MKINTFQFLVSLAASKGIETMGEFDEFVEQYYSQKAIK